MKDWDFSQLGKSSGLQEEVIDFNKIARENFIDVSLEIQRPPIAISIGKYGNNYDIPFGSYGDFSCIVGASKSMKTFLKSAIAAGYIGGNSTEYFPDIKGHETKGKFVIDIDTEQSDYHTQKVARRVCDMVGTNPEFYKPFSLRDKDPKTRLAFIEWIFSESEWRNNLGLVLIDGAADLLDNVNDLEESNKIVNSMLRWTKQSKSHLITVLHRNHGGMKPTGHLGSAITKKAETVAFVTKEDKIVNVSPEYTRNYPFEDFAFELDEKYLPKIAGQFNNQKF